MDRPLQLTKQFVIEAAKEFSDTFNPTGKFPVPIVPMVERKGVDVLDLPGLRRASGVAGQVSNDLSEIQVDAAMYSVSLDAYRFTVAHELAHVILHGEFIRSIGIETKADWKRYLANQDPALNDQVEKEAAIFARYVLVPTGHLLAVWHEVAETLAATGRSIDSLTDETLSIVAGNMARRFKVPTRMLERRLIDEGLIE